MFNELCVTQEIRVRLSVWEIAFFFAPSLAVLRQVRVKQMSTRQVFHHVNSFTSQIFGLSDELENGFASSNHAHINTQLRSLNCSTYVLGKGRTAVALYNVLTFMKIAVNNFRALRKLSTDKVNF